MGFFPRGFPVAVVALVAVVPSMVGAQKTPAGSVKAPLTLRATCDAQTQMMRVQIANTSDRATAFVVGFLAPKTQAQVVNAIDVFAIRIATGADEDYVYVSPKYALADGPPWIVSLAPGASQDLELPLKDFISRLNYSALDPSVAGGARLVFEGRAAAKQVKPVWTGKIETPIDRCRQ
jgi:hypothetical protein